MGTGKCPNVTTAHCRLGVHFRLLYLRAKSSESRGWAILPLLRFSNHLQYIVACICHPLQQGRLQQRGAPTAAACP